MPIPESFRKKIWQLNKTVLPQHTDYAGVMWHGAYLLWLEEARVEALSTVGFPYDLVINKGYELPVVKIDIEYLRPLRCCDEVVVESCLLPRNGPRWPWHTVFYTTRSTIACHAMVDLVLVKIEGPKRRIVRHLSPEMSQLFDVLQNED